jgi:hypothetical protein
METAHDMLLKKFENQKDEIDEYRKQVRKLENLCAFASSLCVILSFILCILLIIKV